MGLRSIWILVLLVWVQRTYAQPKAALALTGMNAVPCMTTELAIVAENTPCKNLSATTDNGTIEYWGDCRFTYRPEKPGPATITVFKKEGSGTRKLTDYLIRVQRLPPPSVSLLHMQKGTSSAAMLRLSRGPEVVYSDFDLGPKFDVYAFTVTVVRNNETIFTRRHRSASREAIGFDKETMEFLQNLRAGDFLWINDIEVRGGGSFYTELNEIEIYAN